MSEKKYYNPVETYEEIEKWINQEVKARKICREKGDFEGSAECGERISCYNRVLKFLEYKTDSCMAFKNW